MFNGRQIGQRMKIKCQISQIPIMQSPSPVITKCKALVTTVRQDLRNPLAMSDVVSFKRNWKFIISGKKGVKYLFVTNYLTAHYIPSKF